MRQTQVITINDDGTELKFKLTALSAVSLQKWMVKAGVALAESGLLETNINSVDVNDILVALSEKGLSFLGKLDPDKTNDLVMELVCKTAKKLVGGAVIDLTETELENTISSIKSLIELEKEVFKLNFSFFVIGGSSDIQASTPRNSDQSRQKISIQSSHKS